MVDTGLIHLYCGDGKGKTTAAIGLTIRCAGRGGRILFCQFLKSRPTGELNILHTLPTVTVLRSHAISKFTFQMTPEELAETKRQQEQFFHQIVQRCQEAPPDMVVLDEIIPACRLQLLDEAAVLSFLQHKPAALEVVLTGRGPSPALMDAADYVSEICKRKHPYDRGITARLGIEE